MFFYPSFNNAFKQVGPLLAINKFRDEHIWLHPWHFSAVILACVLLLVVLSLLLYVLFIRLIKKRANNFLESMNIVAKLTIDKKFLYLSKIAKHNAKLIKELETSWTYYHNTIKNNVIPYLKEFNQVLVQKTSFLQYKKLGVLNKNIFLVEELLINLNQKLSVYLKPTHAYYSLLSETQDVLNKMIRNEYKLVLVYPYVEKYFQKKIKLVIEEIKAISALIQVGFLEKTQQKINHCHLEMKQIIRDLDKVFYVNYYLNIKGKALLKIINEKYLSISNNVLSSLPHNITPAEIKALNDEYHDIQKKVTALMQKNNFEASKSLVSQLESQIKAFYKKIIDFDKNQKKAESLVFKTHQIIDRLNNDYQKLTKYLAFHQKQKHDSQIEDLALEINTAWTLIMQKEFSSIDQALKVLAETAVINQKMLSLKNLTQNKFKLNNEVNQTMQRVSANLIQCQKIIHQIKYARLKFEYEASIDNLTYKINNFKLALDNKSKQTLSFKELNDQASVLEQEGYFLFEKMKNSMLLYLLSDWTVMYLQSFYLNNIANHVQEALLKTENLYKNNHLEAFLQNSIKIIKNQKYK